MGKRKGLVMMRMVRGCLFCEIECVLNIFWLFSTFFREHFYIFDLSCFSTSAERFQAWKMVFENFSVDPSPEDEALIHSWYGLTLYGTRMLVWVAMMILWWSEPIKQKYASTVRKFLTGYGAIICIGKTAFLAPPAHTHIPAIRTSSRARRRRTHARA